MTIQHQIWSSRKLVIAFAKGTMNFRNAKKAMAEIATDPRYQETFEVLLDITQVENHLNLVDIFELASALERPNSILPTHRKIAIVVDNGKTLDQAEFLKLCAQNRGVNIQWFASMSAAEAWLDADIPEH